MVERRPGLAVWIATCGGIGYFPIAPGTAGSALGLGVVIAVGRLPFDRPRLAAILAALAALTFVVGVWAATGGEKFFGRKDPGQVVIDEVLGQMATFLAQPRVPWSWLIAGFLLFRVFDIVKPFPARGAERLPGGWGIMLDDAVAGAYSLVALLLLGFVIK